MNNDLISRNAVMDYLREQQANVIIEKNKNGFVNADVCDGMSSAIGAFLNFILQVPAAYDVDKVVERLEELRDEILSDMAYDNDTVNHYLGYADLMIEAVKSGGVE